MLLTQTEMIYARGVKDLLCNPRYVYGGPGPANGIVTSRGRIIIGYQVTTLLPHLWNSTNL